MTHSHAPTKLPIGFENWSPKSQQEMVLNEVERLLDLAGYYKPKPAPRRPALDEDDKREGEVVRAAAELKARLDRSDLGKIDDAE